MKELRFKIEYALLLFFATVIPLLSRKVVLIMGDMLGTLGYYLIGGRRRIALINLDIAFGADKSKEEKIRIARKSFANFVRIILDLLWFKNKSKDEVLNYVKENEEELNRFKSYFKKGKGVILLVFHFGNWEIMGVAHGYLGLPPLNLMARRLDNPYINEFVNQARQRSGNRVIYKENSAFKVVRGLKRNETIAILADQDMGKKGIFVDFFGVAAATTDSIATFSLATKAPIIPAICYPQKNGDYYVSYGPEISLPSSKSTNQQTKEKSRAKNDIYELTYQCNKYMEERIREHPDLWLWGHKRWKTRPDKSSNLYIANNLKTSYK